MNEQINENTEKELYYLIAKFLENGPCKGAAEVLKKEIENNQFILPKLDCDGNSKSQTFQEFDRKNSFLPANYLALLVGRINSLVEQCYPASIRSLNSLLLRGSCSLLRGNEKEIDSKNSSWYATKVNGAARLLPNNIKTAAIVPSLIGRQISGAKSKRRFFLDCQLYKRLSLQKRVLGHLASVYCVLFDRTGSVIVTGADDKLLKVWSARNGALVATLRGHSAQITDISINMENTLIASGSLDKTIRVWKLTNTHPVAVLQGHTGMITSLQFCPGADKSVRYLMSTGGDGNICFWSWSPDTLEFSLTPNRFNEKSRAGAQMLCSSFSPGGSFIVTGSSDNFIRIYQLYPDGPEKIAELPNHVDHVDSILYSHFGDKFLSGSRDGTAMIWYHRNGEWHATCLDASNRLKDDLKLQDESEAKVKLKVTMICWSTNDKFIITAGTDCCLRVWNTFNGQFVTALKEHTEEVYILEVHPTLPQIFLSAGHDGYIIVWDLYKCEKIKSFYNMLEGQGHGAIFDCKFSPDGLCISATDSHGHLLILGVGFDDRYKKVPYEQFFHTDYRPVIRDANNYVLDDQTQTAPHLMHPPFLVDIDGNPHTENYQLLIPGRTCANLPTMRTPEVVHDLPPLLAEIAAAEAVSNPQPARQRGDELLSPGGGVGLGLRESGDIEGVRQENNTYVSGDITDTDANAWWSRTIIPQNHLYNEKIDEKNRLELGLEEIAKYKKELLKKTRKMSEADNTPGMSRRSAGRGRGGRGRGRSAKVRTPVSYVRASAMFDQGDMAGRDFVNLDAQYSESEPEDWQGESSDSSNDSDWTDHRRQPAKKDQTSEMATRKRRKKKQLSSGEENDEDEETDTADENHHSDHNNEDTEDDQMDEDVDVENASSQSSDGDTVQIKQEEEEVGETSRRSRRRARRNRRIVKREESRSLSPVRRKAPISKKPKKQIFNNVVPSLEENKEEYLKFYQPTEWILNTECRKFPYFPQIGDEVYYLRQGHLLYVMEVIKQNVYDIQEKRQAYKRYDLKPAELCKLVGISYDVGPPKMCSLKLELIGKQKSTGGKKTITVRFHDMPHVVDFLVLKHIFEDSLRNDWREGHRFRCIIDESWYLGKIVEVSPYSQDFPADSFLSLVIQWDSGEDDRLSPWDVETIPQDWGMGDKAEVTEDDKQIYMYRPCHGDWPDEDMDEFIRRVDTGLAEASRIDYIIPFAEPVDTNLYPTYWSFVAFPTDLSTIRSRLTNRFYRRLVALLWEIRQLKPNAEKFNKKGSDIVADASFTVKLLSKFIKDRSHTDINVLNETLQELDESKVYFESEEEEDEGNEDQCVTPTSTNETTEETWKTEASKLLEFIFSKDDAAPFRQPVDTEEFPEYPSKISEPIDLSCIRERLQSNYYSDAEGYIRDFQLIFKNSKTFTTNRRSEIYKMTLRLSALFDARCKVVLEAFNKSIGHADTHWTRRRKQRNTASPTKTASAVDEPCSSNSSRPVRNCRQSSPRKTPITLNEFILQPPSVSTRQERQPSSSIQTRGRRVNGEEFNSTSEEEEEEEIVDEEEVIKHNNRTSAKDSKNNENSEEEISEEIVSEEEYAIEQPVKNTTRRSSRKPQARKRFGDSTDEEDSRRTDDRLHIKKKRRYASDHEPVNDGDKRLKMTLTLPTIEKRSSGRSKTAVNYCEVDNESFERIIKPASATLSSPSGNECSSDDETTNMRSVSSRGRVRKAARKWTDDFE